MLFTKNNLIILIFVFQIQVTVGKSAGYLRGFFQEAISKTGKVSGNSRLMMVVIVVIVVMTVVVMMVIMIVMMVMVMIVMMVVHGGGDDGNSDEDVLHDLT